MAATQSIQGFCIWPFYMFNPFSFFGKHIYASQFNFLILLNADIWRWEMPCRKWHCIWNAVVHVMPKTSVKVDTHQMSVAVTNELLRSLTYWNGFPCVDSDLTHRLARNSRQWSPMRAQSIAGHPVVYSYLCSCCCAAVLLLCCCCAAAVVLLRCCCAAAVVLLCCCFGAAVMLLWCCCAAAVQKEYKRIIKL